MKKLRRSFYTRSTIAVAKDLLGKIFIRKIGNSSLSGMIVETEAYLHTDPASHSYRGKTERNSAMFDTGGHLYVYFTYGMHFCANVVTSNKNTGEAVLIRAVEPIEGIEMMTKNRLLDDRRRHSDDRRLHTLTNGPAKFAQAFQLTRQQSGIDLTKSEMFIVDAGVNVRRMIVAGVRVGISAGKGKKWRFYLKNNPWVSKK